MLADKIFATAVIAAGLLATPVAAVTYDAAASFGVNGSGFAYGSYDATQTTQFVLFDSNSNCVILHVICQRSSSVDLPSAFMSDGTAPQSGTVILTPGKLILHPGQYTQSVFAA